MSDVGGEVREAATGTPAGAAPADVCAAVVSHNARDTLPDCLRGLVEAGFDHDRITVYDVASTDDSRRWLTEHYPEVPLVSLPENLGPNPARNLALSRCPTPFLLLLDGDVQLLPETAARLREAIGDDERIAVATPVVLYSDRPQTVQYRRTWVHFLAEASADVRPLPWSALGGRSMRVGLASGCAPLIRKDAAVKVGLFDERYFFGKTDGEFAYRVTIGGYDIIEPSRAGVLHHHRRRGSAFYQWQLRNRWHFILKNFQLRTLLVILPVLLIHEPLLCGVLLVMGKGGDYVRALGSLLRLAPALPRDRRAVRVMRRRHDWQLLQGRALVIPADLTRRRTLARLAGAYRTLLRGYWAVARRLLAVVSRPMPGGDDRVLRADLDEQYQVTPDPASSAA